ncbi:hypothetical protein B0H17DRAFT_1129569 [Mycena rosella]|uniref:Uncharacterized protein n=1 Tax=Mycena rosella TaxID=1033263 RepID=A0AAD7GKJ6_MYCRO|nr:hypothetical protein B0H17DRAFT_1129569 [Mycena rosella]
MSALSESKILFEKYVNPLGTLACHLGEHISHCLDNDIAYLCFKKEKYAIKDPVGFRVGNIVEMGFSLVAFRQPIRGEEDKQVCKLVLRTLTLLDDSIAKTSLEAAFKARSIQYETVLNCALPTSEPDLPTTQLLRAGVSGCGEKLPDEKREALAK